MTAYSKGARPGLSAHRPPTEQQLGLLRALHERGQRGMGFAEVGRLIGVTSRRAEGLLDALHGRRLLTRTVVGGFLEVTAEGRTLVEAARAAS